MSLITLNTARIRMLFVNDVLVTNLIILMALVTRLSLPYERSNRETSHRIDFYNVYLVSLKSCCYILMYNIFI